MGAALLMIWYRRWFKRTTAHTIELPIQISAALKARLIGFILGIAVLVAGIYGFLQTSDHFALQTFVRKFVISSVAIILVELIIYSAIWQLKAARRRVV